MPEGFEDSLIYIIGGVEYTTTRTETWLKDVFLYNKLEQTFRQATDMPEATASFGHSFYNKDVYVTAGLKSETELWNFHAFKGEVNLG